MQWFGKRFGGKERRARSNLFWKRAFGLRLYTYWTHVSWGGIGTITTSAPISVSQPQLCLYPYLWPCFCIQPQKLPDLQFLPRLLGSLKLMVLFIHIIWVYPAAAAAAAKSLQSCPTLCDPIDGSPPGSAVPGILQARTLEWVAISFSSASPKLLPIF